MDVVFNWDLGNMIYNGHITLRLCGFPFMEIRSLHSHPLTYMVAIEHASGRLPQALQVGDMQKNNTVEHIVLYKEYEKLFELENGHTH